jgi:glycine cleavage system P protein (glycine dehydrogenase) subunit 1
MHYLPLTLDDIREMLRTVGVEKFDDLLSSIPESIKLKQEMNLPRALSESELRILAKSIANENYNPDETACFAGGVAFNHYIPSAVNHLSSLPELLTAYTPYQPELSQGTLTATFEWQTAISNLTGLDVANASLYDGATAACEAARVACNQKRATKIAVSELLHPAYIETLKSYAKNIGFEIVYIPADGDRTSVEELKKVSGGVACVIVQSPNFLGTIEDIEALTAEKSTSVFVQVITETISLGLLKRPGDMGVDICCGEAQSFGIPMGFGGPHLGFMATDKKFMRKLPGRIVGESVDRHGNRSLTLTLRPREQDIKREKATSNICTNNGNAMLRGIIYLALMGKKGLREVAKQNFDKAHYLAKKLQENGFQLKNENPFFNEVTIIIPDAPENLQETMLKKGFVVTNVTDDGLLILSATEMNSKKSMDEFARALTEVTR